MYVLFTSHEQVNLYTLDNKAKGVLHITRKLKTLDNKTKGVLYSIP